MQWIRHLKSEKYRNCASFLVVSNMKCPMTTLMLHHPVFLSPGPVFPSIYASHSVFRNSVFGQPDYHWYFYFLQVTAGIVLQRALACLKTPYIGGDRCTDDYNRCRKGYNRWRATFNHYFLEKGESRLRQDICWWWGSFEGFPCNSSSNYAATLPCGSCRDGDAKAHQNKTESL